MGNKVVFGDSDSIETLLYKLLLVLTENREIDCIADIKRRFCNKSGFLMSLEKDYTTLITELKNHNYIEPNDTIKVKIKSKRMIIEKSVDKYYFELGYVLEGEEVILTEKGKQFMENYKKNYY